MQQQDLSELFARSMNFTNPVSVPSQPPETQKPEQQHLSAQPVTYASAHYTHSSHIPRTPATNTPTPLEEVHLVAILQQNSIDPRLLFPNQITLFQNADDDQRLRLLELWRIAPPTCAADGLARELGTWPETSLQREEEQARTRYERTMQEKQQQAEEQMMMLQRHPEDRQGQHGLWQSQPMEEMMSDVEPELSLSSSAPATLPSSPVFDQRNAEPYILSGYEQLAKRDYDRQPGVFGGSTRYNRATDPAYALGKRDVTDMENNYGSYAAVREYELPSPGAQKTHFVGFDPMDGDCVM